ncbi:MAG: hypothetical protein MZU84_04485 [Sphingobacterium sp.]|nr:hypothetical protein [Sphingobacterium sp.]
MPIGDCRADSAWHGPALFEYMKREAARRDAIPADAREFGDRGPGVRPLSRHSRAADQPAAIP